MAEIIDFGVPRARKIMKWTMSNRLQHPHNPKLCGKRSISTQKLPTKKIFFSQKMFFRNIFHFLRLLEMSNFAFLKDFLLCAQQRSSHDYPPIKITKNILFKLCATFLACRWVNRLESPTTSRGNAFMIRVHSIFSFFRFQNIFFMAFLKFCIFFIAYFDDF